MAAVPVERRDVVDEDVDERLRQFAPRRRPALLGVRSHTTREDAHGRLAMGGVRHVVQKRLDGARRPYQSLAGLVEGIVVDHAAQRG